MPAKQNFHSSKRLFTDFLNTVGHSCYNHVWIVHFYTINSLSRLGPLISLIEVMGGDVSGQNKFVVSLELPAASLKYPLLIKV